MHIDKNQGRLYKKWNHFQYINGKCTFLLGVFYNIVKITLKFISVNRLITYF